jgi:hypothetical protein
MEAAVLRHRPLWLRALATGVRRRRGDFVQGGPCQCAIPAPGAYRLIVPDVIALSCSSNT